MKKPVSSLDPSKNTPISIVEKNAPTTLDAGRIATVEPHPS
jgi:hypothetical protein